MLILIVIMLLALIFSNIYTQYKAHKTRGVLVKHQGPAPKTTDERLNHIEITLDNLILLLTK